MTEDRAGRSCPIRYRYSTNSIAAAPEQLAGTLYVIGGLYGNTAALDAVELMAQEEAQAPTLCFNGDFNWFNIDDDSFAEVNRRVMFHDATLGNVEAELCGPGGTDDVGCGCAYPSSVDDEIVARSNAIHRELTATSRRHPFVRAALARLPMFARYRVADCRIGVVHGDYESLAGWSFDVSSLDDPNSMAALRKAFKKANVDVFASTHTCLPALRLLELDENQGACVANNGAAGMPNFEADRRGLLVRISEVPAAQAEFGEVHLRGAYISLQPIAYDAARWNNSFLSQWPAGSPAWESYYRRIVEGPNYSPLQAVPWHVQRD